MAKGKILAFCEHDYKGTKFCRCGARSNRQMRTYIRPGPHREGSLAFSLYTCVNCVAAFKQKLTAAGFDKDWYVKINPLDYKMTARVDFTG
jgi:hypothetical protein